MSVNSEMTALADAIREKSGRTEKMGIAAMKEAVKGISAGIDTSDATATAADIASGKTAYVGGHKITGSVTSYDSQTGWNNVTPVVSGDNLRLSRDTNIPYLFRKGFYLGTPLSNLGDASASDVAKGKTFTSANGLKLTGTLEGGGLPSGISKLATGSFTPASDQSTSQKITFDFNDKPDLIVVFADTGDSLIGTELNGCFLGAVYSGMKHTVGTSTFNVVQSVVYLTSGGSLTSSQRHNNAASGYVNVTPSNCLFKGGITHRWIACVFE